MRVYTQVTAGFKPPAYFTDMKRIVFLSSFILIALTCADAQTKRIEHRSHSGSNKTFSLSNSSNFGALPSHFSKKDYLRTDSMIRNDSIMMYWYDSLNRVNSANNAHALQKPANPQPGKGAAAGAAAATGITSR